MSAFDRAMMRIRTAEGGFVDHPNDRGGRTKYGISQRAYPSVDVEHLTWEHAAEIYKADFWDKLGLGDLPEPVAIKLMDIAVNCGVGGAAWVVQRALSFLGVPILLDGDLGPKTRAAIRQQRRLRPLLAAICGCQFARYQDIVARDPKQAVFAAGWALRAWWVPELPEE